MLNYPTFKFILSDGTLVWDLPQAPDGWEESFIEWERNLTHFGIIRNYSIPLKWTLDGSFFLRNVFYKKGVQGFTEVLIQKLNPSTLEYLDCYRGTIDYSSLVDNLVTVEVNIMDSGMAEKLKAYEHTKYEISLDDPDAITIGFNGIELEETGTYITDTVPNIDAAIESTNAIVGVTLEGFEARSSSATAQSAEYENFNLGDPAPNLSTSTNWFYQASTSSTFHIEGRLEFESFQDSANIIDLLVAFLITRFGVSPQLNNFICNNVVIPADSTWHSHTFAFSFDIPMVAGDKLFFRYASNGPFGSSSGTRVIPTSFQVNGTVISAPTGALALRADHVFNRLVEKITGATGNTQSFLLTNSSLFYTCGDALRQLTGPSLKLSLRDFVKDFYGISCAGLGVENEKAVLERRDYFFRRSQKIDSLGSVQNASFEVAEEFIWNTLKTGSPDQTVDDLNGRYEVNSEVQWTTPITRVAQEYDILTSSRTDAYGIEFTRINLVGKTTTDASSDNETFIVDVQDQGSFFTAAVAAERYTSASGVPAVDSVYNLILSPKQNLLRHNYWLASMLWGQEQAFISWQSALKDHNLSTTNDFGQVVDEDSDIYIQDLGEKLYYPIIATIQTKYSKNLVNLINNTPYGYLEFTYLDNTYRGYILAASYNPGNNDEKEFKLLLTPDNDLNTLIR